MRRNSDTKRLARLGLGGLVLGVLACAVSPAYGDLIEDRELNFALEIPPGWSRLPQTEAWGEYGIVVGAVRQLEKLKEGGTANGEGGLIHLAVTDAPEGKDMDAIAADPTIRGFLLNRFSSDPTAWPEIDVVPDVWDGGVHVRLVRARGEAPNLKAKKAPVRAVMMLLVVKQRLYKLRMYAWTTERDAEGIKDDLDVIEMNFEVLDTKEDAPKEDGPPPDMEDEGEDEVTGDEGIEKTLEDLKVGWRMKKPVGIKSKDWDKKKYKDAVAWFEDSDAVGSYQVIVYVIPRARRNDQNQVIPDQDIKEWALDKWWMRFDRDHPGGPIWTYKWPRRSKAYFEMPDFEAKKVLWATIKKRPKQPEKIDGSELVKKLKAAQKLKTQKMGEEKTIEAYRGVLGGSRQKIGEEIVLRYAWGTPRVTCMVSVSLARGGMKKWHKAVESLLMSIEMTGRP